MSFGLVTAQYWKSICSNGPGTFIAGRDFEIFFFPACGFWLHHNPPAVLLLLLLVRFEEDCF
ncbi:hypothetical protein GFC01_10640 [Desulfofundulus thermobenzoicus]|uniref:Uncharacterized protein n=1 Tax=Desulfofundulus thermobenzoicus TaxID=29376 RepID=A0A6N7IRN6_9FIRM|nr:hypothetical protein [Desulfofundulus thermobenzoicus]MQL52710.1 hypothetical protein [Desulfofundulus thermobenzoicus]